MVCSSYCILSAHKPPCYSISDSMKQSYCWISRFFWERLNSNIQAEIQTFSPSKREGDGRFNLISTILPKSKQFSTLRKNFCKGNEYAMRLRKSGTSFECLASCLWFCDSVMSASGLLLILLCSWSPYPVMILWLFLFRHGYLWVIHSLKWDGTGVLCSEKSRETFVWVSEVCQDQIMLNKFRLVIILIQCLKQILVMEIRLEYYSENVVIFPNFAHFGFAGQTVVIES